MKLREELPEWIKSLVVVNHLTPGFDNKAEYHKYLEEKYFR
jgi:hypothetical protein